MRYITSAIFLDIWNKKKSHWSFFCAICVCILHIWGHAMGAILLRSFWHHRRCPMTNRAVSRTAYILVHFVQKKSFSSSSSSFPSANILAPLERISKESFSNQNILHENHISHCRTCGCLRGKEERKSLCVPVFSIFQFQKTRKARTICSQRSTSL